MRVQTAINMLRDHGFKAFECAEGVVAIGQASFIEVRPADDAECEAYTVFDVTRRNADHVWAVDDDAIKAFCAY